MIEFPTDSTVPPRSAYTETPWGDGNGTNWLYQPAVNRWVPAASGGVAGPVAWSDITGIPAAVSGTTASFTTALETLLGTAVQPAALAAYVPTIRTINGQALSANLTLTPADIGAAASSHTHTASAITDFASAAAAAAPIQTAGTGLALAGTTINLQAPGTATIGGVMRNTGTEGQFVTGINESGQLLFGTPAGGGGGPTFAGQPVTDVVAGSNITFSIVGGVATLNVSAGSATIGDGTYGDIVVSGTGTIWTIGNNAVTSAKILNSAVTNAKLANNTIADAKLVNVAANTIKGRITAGSGSVQNLTAGDVRTIINVEDGATANSPDATLLARANHTGTQNANTLTGTAWRLFYTNGSNAMTELPLGADGTFLKSNGESSAPSFAAPSGSGDALTSGTLDQFANVTQEAGATFAITATASISGTNTGDQDLSGLASLTAANTFTGSTTTFQPGNATNQARVRITSFMDWVYLYIGDMLIDSESQSINGVQIPTNRQYFANTDRSDGTPTKGIIEHVNITSGGRVLVLDDASKMIRFSGTVDNNTEVPLNSSVPFPVGTVVYLRRMTGAVALSVTGASGVTINNNAAADVPVGGTCALHKVATDEWDFI